MSSKIFLQALQSKLKGGNAKSIHRNIAFIGGIHGSGKSTACRSICDVVEIEHITASSLLKWEGADKKVSDISGNQDKLIVGLNALVEKKKKYLLDGHYCLLNKSGDIEVVPVKTFTQIQPFSLNLIIEDVAIIQSRLEQRDNKPYDRNLLNEMQKSEISHANKISSFLRIKLNTCKSNNVTDIINTIKLYAL